LQKFDKIEEIMRLEKIFNVKVTDHKSTEIVNDIEKQRELFKKLDIDGSGTIDLQEFV
jgi:hypothetical protein